MAAGGKGSAARLEQHVAAKPAPRHGKAGLDDEAEPAVVAQLCLTEAAVVPTTFGALMPTVAMRIAVPVGARRW